MTVNVERISMAGGAMQVYPLVLGGNTFGWTSDESTSQAVLDSFVEAGGNLIDTADVYSAWAPGRAGGESEIILGRWMATRRNRDKVLIATKVSQHPQYPGLSAANVAVAADESLLRLGTDHIDIYYAHFDDAHTPLEETVEAFDSLVKAGKIRAVALSNYSAQRVEEWFRIAKAHGYALPVALEPHYNLVHRAEFEGQLAPVAEREHLAVFPYYSLASGFLTGKYRSASDVRGVARADSVAPYANDQGFGVIAALQDVAGNHRVSIAAVALAWLRQHAQVTAPIASARIPRQLPALIDSVSLTLSDDEMRRLASASESFAH